MFLAVMVGRNNRGLTLIEQGSQDNSSSPHASSSSPHVDENDKIDKVNPADEADKMEMSCFCVCSSGKKENKVFLF